jgi:hypothetical protein
MPKRTLGPFPGLAGLAAIDVNTAKALDIKTRCDLINGVLKDAGCNCNGHAAGHQRDEYWAHDISDLVSRCTAHDIHTVDDDGVLQTETVAIKIETLLVEVDSNNEICAWIYEESQVNN